MAKVVELILLFIACFSAVFNLLCYFLQLSLFSKSLYHLIVAVVCVVIVLVVLILYLKRDSDKTADSEETVSYQPEITDSPVENNQPSTVVPNDFDDQIIEQEQTEQEYIEENEFDDSNDVIDSTANYFAKTIQQEETELELDLNESEPVNADLTNTQILYIQNSKNSYFNEQGMPQLVVTKEIDANKVNRAYLNQQIIDQQKQQQLEKEEEQFLLEEKQERTIEILNAVLIVLVLANLLLLIYYLYMRFM